MAREMSPDERRAFLTKGTRTATLATTHEDGRPLAIPIGFELDGDELVMLTHPGSAKGRAIQRDPRVALVVDDPTPPFAFVMIEGTARTSLGPDNDEWRAAAKVIGRRYGGPDDVDAFEQYAAEALKLFIRVTPTRTVARDRVGEP